MNKKNKKFFVIKFSINLELSRVMLYNVVSKKTVGKFSVYALACEMYFFAVIAYNVSREQFFGGSVLGFFILKISLFLRPCFSKKFSIFKLFATIFLINFFAKSFLCSNLKTIATFFRFFCYCPIDRFRTFLYNNIYDIII